MRDRISVKKLIICGSVLLVLILAVSFLAFFRLEKVEVIKSGEFYSDEQIKEMVLNSPVDDFTYLFALRAKYMGLDEIPFVEKIDYEVVDKNTLKIYIYERQIVGCVNVMGKYLCFDREGIVAGSTDVPPEGVVVVSGITVGDAVIGQKLETSADIFKGLMEIVGLINKNRIAVDEIVYDFRENITLMIDDDEVLLGEKDSYDLEINNLSSIMQSVGEGAYRFDLRYMNSENMSVTAKPIEK